MKVEHQRGTPDAAALPMAAKSPNLPKIERQFILLRPYGKKG
jgi:hypothetical protein